tara:strand:- start:250 stop:450 length:201 start_codon:yes stop_codon:yes gene_type:complete
MLLSIKEGTKKIHATPTIQCRVNDAIFKKFSDLAKHYNCSNAALLKSVIEDSLQRLEGVIQRQILP